MVVATAGLSLALCLVLGILAGDFTTLLLSVFAWFPITLAACGWAIFGSFFMLPLLQRLLIATGNQSGRPTEFRLFVRYLMRYSLVPALLPCLLWLVPHVRQAAGPALLLLGTWAVATVATWRYYAHRLHAEWEAGQPY